MKTPPRKNAFTLLELLAVIAIIAILAALAIPVVGKMRQSALRMQSLSNLRQIGLTLLGHAQENQGILVHAQDILNSGDRFSNVLQNYLEGNSPGTPQWVSASGVSKGFRRRNFYSVKVKS